MPSSTAMQDNPPLRGTRAVFTGAVLLSATLLFMLQPMYARMALPRLGGSPIVWSIATIVYQSVLLAGYAVAGEVATRMRPAAFAALHLVLMFAVFAVALPMQPPQPTDGSLSVGTLLSSFVFGIGLPFFTLSINSPLLQHWFSLSKDPHAHDPYFLYSASNVGSLVALMTYPFLIEPWFPLTAQASVWRGAYLILAALLAASAWAIRDAPPAHTAARTPATWSQLASWTGLAALPSALIVAQTASLSTDLPPMPFLWVLPLAVYMVTWVVAFSANSSALVAAHGLHVGAGLGLAAIALTIPVGIAGTLLPTLAATYLIGVACHTRLKDSRPPASALGTFYLCVSLGGVVGSTLAGLAAPLLLNGPWEVLIVYTIAAGASSGMQPRARVGLLAGAAVAAVVGAWLQQLPPRVDLVPIATYLFVAGLGSYVVARGDLPITRTLAAGLVSGVLITGATDREPLLRTRSLFSSYRVSNEDGIVTLRNGTTVHGAGRFEETGRPVPTAYYHPTSPIAQAIASARARKGSVSVATVGLGAGTMACLRADGERWRYFEIDPVVVDIARNPVLFHFIDRCDPQADIVVGDARLTLDDDPDARWDVLVLDAFSSDAIPTHLLTQEAMRLYQAALAPDGLIVIHISNREFDLRGPIQATAATLGLKAIQRTDQVEKQFPIVLRSRVAVLSASDEALAPLSAEGWTPILPGRPIDPWTDDHTNLMVALFHD